MYDSLFDIGYDGVSNEFGLGFWGGFLKPLIRVGMRNPGDVSAAGKFMLFMLTTFTSIVFLALLYFVARHVLYTLGKKAGQENGWMAFVPVARAIYLCKLADMPIGFIPIAMVYIVKCFCTDYSYNSSFICNCFHSYKNNDSYETSG